MYYIFHLLYNRHIHNNLTKLEFLDHAPLIEKTHQLMCLPTPQTSAKRKSTTLCAFNFDSTLNDKDSIKNKEIISDSIGALQEYSSNKPVS